MFTDRRMVLKNRELWNYTMQDSAQKGMDDYFG
jgi:hypothetical protein